MSRAPKERYPCPICRKPVSRVVATFPFCCDRCRLVDLGGWLTERYSVSRSLIPTSGDDPLAGGEAEEDVSSADADAIDG